MSDASGTGSYPQDVQGGGDAGSSSSNSGSDSSGVEETVVKRPQVKNPKPPGQGLSFAAESAHLAAHALIYAGISIKNLRNLSVNIHNEKELLQYPLLPVDDAMKESLKRSEKFVVNIRGTVFSIAYTVLCLFSI